MEESCRKGSWWVWHGRGGQLLPLWGCSGGLVVSTTRCEKAKKEGKMDELGELKSSGCWRF